MAYYHYNNPPAPSGAQQSKYHAAFQKIQRLHDSWVIVRRNWREGDFQAMHHELENIWAELEADSSSPQHKIILLFNINISRLMTQLYFMKQQNPIQLLRVKAKLSSWLSRKRYFLYRIEKSQGLGKKYKEEDEELF